MKHVIYNYSDNDIDFIVVLLHKATRSTFCIISRTRILEKDSFQRWYIEIDFIVVKDSFLSKRNV